MERDERPIAAVVPLGMGAAVETAQDEQRLRREITRQHYVLASILFVGGGVGALLPDALHDPPHPTTVYLLPLLAVVSGLVVWTLAGRLPRGALHVVAVIAALEVALTAALADQVFSIYFTFIAIFAAYVIESRRAIGLHVAFVSLIAFAPLIYDPDMARQNLIQALVLVPTLILAAGAVAFLRERLAASEARYRQLSEIDPLTGVGNYRMLSQRVPQELRRHRRHGRPLSLLVIDLDDFKRINDSYGHQRGDMVLQEVAAALLGGVRDHDIVVRQGGDEFAVVAPETDREEADHLHRRLCEAVKGVSPDGDPIGASIGCAFFPADAETLEGLLASADARLRDAKDAKPNRYDRGSVRPEAAGPRGRAHHLTVPALGSRWSMSLARFVTSRRGRLVVIAAWIPIAVVGLILHAKINDVTAAGQRSFLPSDSESTRVVEILGSEFSGGDDIPALVVFERSGGLTSSDRKAIGELGEKLTKLDLVGGSAVLDPLSEAGADDLPGGLGLLSKDGDAAIVALEINANERNAISDGVARIRALLAENEVPGLQAHVTGPAGVAADLEQVADDAGRTLLIATVSLVLLLLLLVYRAPLLALTPLVVVGVAYLMASAIAYGLIEADLITVNTEGTFLLLVLVFGAGTDYSLLLVHRYREELARGGSAQEALALATHASMPPIGASAGTVMAAMLVLLLADLESTHWLGPILAIGIAVMLLASFTLLPALLSLLGERAFWPAREVGGGGPPAIWDRVAALVSSRGRLLVGAITTLLIVLAAGNFIHHGSIGFGQGETKPTDSGRGTAVIDAHYPEGVSAPILALIVSDDAADAVDDINDSKAIAVAAPFNESSNKELTVIGVISEGNPYGEAGIEVVEELRSNLAEINSDALVGGVPAENLDVQDANARDTKVIVPAVVLVVFLILCLVLRSLVAPLYLMATVVLSFAATLGLVTLLFSQVFGEGLAFNLVLLSFLFLVALGVDYNIFLMTRVREEAQSTDTPTAVGRALVATGSVVTGAGVILAGTFATLTLLPLEALVQIGATVAIGVLLDTFIVRALLVPSLTGLLGERAWWPSRRDAG